MAADKTFSHFSHNVVIKTFACWANRVRDLWCECSNVSSVSSRFSSVSTVFCLIYLLCEKFPVECTFFTNLKIVGEAGTQTPWRLWHETSVAVMPNVDQSLMRTHWSLLIKIQITEDPTQTLLSRCHFWITKLELWNEQQKTQHIVVYLHLAEQFGHNCD
jgi:hypothetical protein